MYQRLKPLIVLLAALAMALIWSIPASAGVDDVLEQVTEAVQTDGAEPTTTDDDSPSPTTEPEDAESETTVPPTTVPPVPPVTTTPESTPERTTPESTTPESTTATPAAPTPGSAQARVGTLAVPESPLAALAVLPTDFTPEDLADLLEELGLPALTPDQLADLFEALQPPDEDPLEEFCSMFGVPLFCGEIPTGPDAPPFSCDQFAVLFGLGSSCDDIPFCIPVPAPPAGLPFTPPAPPSPPFCERPSTPTTPGTPTTPNNPNHPGYHQPGQHHGGGYHYKNCDEAHRAGAGQVHYGQYGYGSHLDADYDGVGCEENYGTYTPTVQPVAQQVAYDNQAGKLAYTGVTVQPLLAWGAALLLAGGWLIRSSRRRA